MERLLGKMINHTENVGHIVYKGEALLETLLGKGGASREAEIKLIFGEQKHKELVRFARVVVSAGRESTNLLD